MNCFKVLADKKYKDEIEWRKDKPPKQKAATWPLFVMKSGSFLEAFVWLLLFLERLSAVTRSHI